MISIQYYKSIKYHPIKKYEPVPPLEIEEIDHDDHQQQQQGDDDEEEFEHEFSFDLPIIPFISHSEKRHKALSKLLRLGNHNDDELIQIFITMATIIDPMTQPMESDNHILSINLISDVIIGIFYNQKSIIPNFELSKKLFLIIESSLFFLNCNDEVKLRGLNNSDLKIDWRLKLNEWTPKYKINDEDLKLIYLINSVAIFIIYKIYFWENNDLCLNPYLGFFLKLWKIFTNIVLLGLEIDRRIESDSNPNSTTPNIVKQVIRGSSSIRYILATILNDDIPNRFHDLNHVNISNFISPFARENGVGSLHADVRWYVGSMLALGSDLNEVVETLVDLEPNDRYDEDVRYMFDYEYEDFHYEDIFNENEQEEEFKNGEPIVYEDEDGHLHKVIRKRCTCEFFHDEDEDEQEDETEDYKNLSPEEIQKRLDIDPEEFNKNNAPTAIRSNDEIEFDEMGRDWRDIPRGGNIFFNTEVQLDESNCLTWDELIKTFTQMSHETIDDELSQKVIYTIARSVKLEFENDINKSINGDNLSKSNEITPDMIYEKWSFEWLFEPILRFNPQAAYSMLDEMLMAHGYRRVIIWFVTHLTLSFPLINYICELLLGIRGTSSIDEEGKHIRKFKFSRQGFLELSEIEKSMLLHEFLNNCLVHLSKDFGKFNDESEGSEEQDSINASNFEKKTLTIKMVCILIFKLDLNKIIELQDYKIELTTLLINWIGYVPEARQLFFILNKNHQQDHPHEQQEDEEEGKLILKPTTKKQKKFNSNLKILLSNVLKKIADNNKTGNLLFQPFFELIDNNNEGVDDGVISQIEPELNYIKGEIKPLIRNEELNHAKVEQVLNH
ncbi:hypothetical protein BN7_1409 [Wickerhamomyces ciferrii]|uniref:Uncharacterized protein n=1 Tax=Wickerhamomyces ciferrii (strain ATCC 14091 / BCRC 22168 / CBS 111 / JCM 3599 / NBRC 0793 / NRRL Y-1031 F-60-10) TaxID=1206466 RepID=K0KAA1_WICCF|nr:uncharacterized protein BN7_1409 [Wickerhamomyces ciferrii]CCH41870.1 hypothetical protein BN7_1409 [Wickerhamomyces ciferrii]